MAFHKRLKAFPDYYYSIISDKVYFFCWSLSSLAGRLALSHTVPDQRKKCAPRLFVRTLRLITRARCNCVGRLAIVNDHSLGITHTYTQNGPSSVVDPPERSAFNLPVYKHIFHNEAIKYVNLSLFFSLSFSVAVHYSWSTDIDPVPLGCTVQARFLLWRWITETSIPCVDRESVVANIHWCDIARRFGKS